MLSGSAKMICMLVVAPTFLQSSLQRDRGQHRVVHIFRVRSAKVSRGVYVGSTSARTTECRCF